MNDSTMVQADSREIYPCPICDDSVCDGECDHGTDAERDVEQDKFLAEAQEIRDGDIARGWPGDGSGEDDLADFNANEANDYLNE